MQLYTFFVSLFTLSEVLLLILKKSKKSSVKSRNDGRSLLLLWIVISGCLVTGYIVARMNTATTGNPSTFDITGVSIIIIGFITRWIAIIQLGNMFTVDVAISATHTLKTNGLYKIVRHPSYLGLLLIIAGLAFLMHNVLSCVIIIVPVFLAINYRISVEEKALIGEFDDQYLNYKLKVKKILPLLY